VLITFDDGYKNNVTVAAPILTQEHFPAVFFLATGYIGTGRVLWNHEVRQRVMAWPREGIRLPDGRTLSLISGSDIRKKLAEQINQQLKRLTEDACQEYQEYLRHMTPSASLMDDPKARAFMDWNDARTLVSAGFEIGSHTVEHPILSSIKDISRLSNELRHSKGTLERELGKPCLALAYPNGTTQDVSSEVFQEACAAGYQWGFMTTPVWQAPAGDPYQLARIGVPGHADMPTFTLYVSGLRTQFSGAT
jgi:peptidoglycan/xylan/chitin deacetylase (PgdA/CDA1 family)